MRPRIDTITPIYKDVKRSTPKNLPMLLDFLTFIDHINFSKNKNKKRKKEKRRRRRRKKNIRL